MSETCQACGSQYESIYWVPDDVWQKIKPKENGGLLCMECAWTRARDAGFILYFSGNLGGWLEDEQALLLDEAERPEAEIREMQINLAGGVW